MNYPFCPVCGADDSISPSTKIDNFDIKGEKIKVTSEVMKCSKCQNEFSNLDDTYSTIEKARSIYREKHNIPSPADIKVFMDEHKLSLRNMELLTGIAFKTIDRYLKGAIPDPSNIKLLKIYMNYPKVLLDALNENPAFSPKKFIAVKEKLRLSVKPPAAPSQGGTHFMQFSVDYCSESVSSKKICSIPLGVTKATKTSSTCLPPTVRTRYSNQLRPA